MLLWQRAGSAQRRARRLMCVFEEVGNRVAKTVMAQALAVRGVVACNVLSDLQRKWTRQVVRD